VVIANVLVRAFSVNLGKLTGSISGRTKRKTNRWTVFLYHKFSGLSELEFGKMPLLTGLRSDIASIEGSVWAATVLLMGATV